MTEIIIHTNDKPFLRDCLRTHELFENDQFIIINDNYGNRNDTGSSLHAAYCKTRRIPKFLYDEFKNRQVEAITIDNDTGMISVILWA